MSGQQFAIPEELGRRMCAAWGINPAECLGIDIRWRPFELPTAFVNLALSESAVCELLTLDVVERRMLTADEVTQMLDDHPTEDLQ